MSEIELLYIITIRVVEFSSKGYKIRKKFGLEAWGWNVQNRFVMNFYY